jgi:hypothetical protein
MQFRLRTLLIVLAVGPVVLAGGRLQKRMRARLSSDLVCGWEAMRYSLRTAMAVLAVGPPVLAAALVSPRLALLACFLPLAIAIYIVGNLVLMHALAWATGWLVDTLLGRE